MDNETISVDGKNIQVVSNRDPLKLPWAELGIDIVIEVILYLPCTAKGNLQCHTDSLNVSSLNTEGYWSVRGRPRRR